MLRLTAALIAAIGFALSAAGPAMAQADPQAMAPRRVALVIGVAEYLNLPQLTRPAEDAQAVHEVLEGLGFESTLVLDPEDRALDEAVVRFTQSLQPDDVALVHFTGHAARLNDDFLFLPVNAPAVGAGGEDLRRTGGVGLSALADEIRAAGARAQLFFVDGCRGDPYAQEGAAELGASFCGEAGRQMPEGSFVLFSASAGQKALDRLAANEPEPHSLFTRVLLSHLEEVRSVVRLARVVHDEVVETAASVNHQQRPAYLDELVGPPVLLAPREPRREAAQAPPSADVLPAPDRPAPQPRREAPASAFQCGSSSPGAPAFSCRSARRDAEVLICRDERLGGCDQTLNALFDQAQERMGRGASGLRRSQDRWLAERDSCAERSPDEAAAVDCIGRAYDARIAELDPIVTGSLPRPASGPSFDCTYARSAVERAICQDPALAAKDREMAELFADARSGDPRGVERAQREWRAMRDSCARMADTEPSLQACIGEAYDIRIGQLGGAGQR